MKSIVCEMCGSNEILKQDGVYVCQCCGTKYSVEDAKTLMIEGTVDVSGSAVRIDETLAIERLYEAARKAKSANIWESAQNYYTQIFQLDPQSWEAFFFTTYASAMTCTIAQIEDAATRISNLIQPTIELIKDNVAQDKQKAAYSTIVVDCMSAAELLCTSALNHYREHSNVAGTRGDYCRRVYACWRLLRNLADSLIDLAGKDQVLPIYKRMNTPLFSQFMSVELVDMITNTIKKYEPSYESPVKGVKTSGCYIATAVYGSYDCQQVWVLRRYRDLILGRTWYGRSFIRTYYAISPRLVAWFGDTVWFKKTWMGILDCIVSNLKTKGIADTPYQDQNW